MIILQKYGVINSILLISFIVKKMCVFLKFYLKIIKRFQKTDIVVNIYGLEKGGIYSMVTFINYLGILLFRK